ncbi:hypothetical protein NKG94_25070 [Micromonospora sp. M12]
MTFTEALATRRPLTATAPSSAPARVPPDRAARDVRVEAGRRLEQEHRARRRPCLRPARGRVRHRAVHR